MLDFFEWICNVISEEMSFDLFSPIWSHVNKNEKKIVKEKCKILKKKGNFWRYGEKLPFLDNLALICLTGSDKIGFTDD